MSRGRCILALLLIGHPHGVVAAEAPTAPAQTLFDEDAPPAPPTTPPATTVPAPPDPRLGIVPAKLQLGMAVNAVLDVCPDMVEISRRGPKRVFAAPSCVQVQSDIPTAAHLTFRNDRLTLYSVSAQLEHAISAVAHFVIARGRLRGVHGRAACASRDERVCLSGDAQEQVDCLLGTPTHSGRLVNDRVVACSARHDGGSRVLSIAAAVNPMGPLPWTLTAVFGATGVP